MYKRLIYQIAESNGIEKIDSIARIESKLFLLELECSIVHMAIIPCVLTVSKPEHACY